MGLIEFGGCPSHLKPRCRVSRRTVMQRSLLVATVTVMLYSGTSNSATAIAASPRVLVPGFQLQEVAAAPDIVTPIAIAFDHHEHLLVIESHTHQRPDDYPGPLHDRVVRLIDDDQDGRADRFETFLDDTDQTMSLARGPEDWIYVATRRDVFRVRDRDGDGRADQRQTVVRLETVGDYPHNGLAGLTFAQDGRLYFGLGENLGASYRLIGTDGSTLHGEGEGGSVFVCQPDGSQVQRVATGFWNPFGSSFDPYQRLFTVDNDPDASPPCRLLNVVAAGDYGYQFRYGRSGRHPLQAWDAELPGTLPMAGGTGEAPCQVVPYRGRLWISSWGDFRIEAHEVHIVGAGVQTQSEIIVQGDAKFRPVGLAPAADGSLYFSDWVERSYPVHQQGRIWRLIPDAAPSDEFAFPEPSAEEQRAAALRTSTDRDTLLDAVLDDDVFIRQAACAGLAASGHAEAIDWLQLDHPRQRLGVLEALHWQNPEAASRLIQPALQDPNDAVCIYALRMIAERRAQPYRQDILDLLSHREPLGAQLGAVALAALAWLDEGQESKDLTALHARLAQYLSDPQPPCSVRTPATPPAETRPPTAGRCRRHLGGPSLSRRGPAARGNRNIPVLSLRDPRRRLRCTDGHGSGASRGFDRFASRCRRRCPLRGRT
jgi:putative membrane-bound dehydrogenase-like protein